MITFSCLAVGDMSNGTNEANGGSGYIFKFIANFSVKNLVFPINKRIFALLKTENKTKLIMKSLFILQLVCCVITAMLALHLAMASLQVKWRVWRYEVSRWLLFVSMLFISVHYVLQMIHGLRVQGADVGAAVNMLFYTPVAFVINLSILNMESTAKTVRRYCQRCAIAYGLIIATFTIGVVRNQSLHIGGLLYVMLVLFAASLVYSMVVIRREINLRKNRLLEDSGTDFIPYVRYSKTSLSLVQFTSVFMPIAILFTPLLYVVGPFVLLSIIFFVHTFVALGYYITPKVELLGELADQRDEAAAKANNADTTEGSHHLSVCSLSETQMEAMKQAIGVWCKERQFKDSDANIYSLAIKLGYKKDELTEYFNRSEHVNFRTWLNDIRFNEAVRMMKAYPNYSIDAISTECGFSSHTWINRIFKQKTGLSPIQWRRQYASA